MSAWSPLLGVIKAGSFAAPAAWLPLLAAEACVISVVFLLIRGRHRTWYLTDHHLNRRAAIATTTVVLVSTTISGLGLLARGTHGIAWPVTGAALQGVFLAFVHGVASLVVSSALFMIAVTTAADLPGLPTKRFVSLLTTARQTCAGLAEHPIWGAMPATDPALVQETQLLATTARELAREAPRPARRFHTAFADATDALGEAVSAVHRSRDAYREHTWGEHFGASQGEALRLLRRVMGIADA